MRKPKRIRRVALVSLPVVLAAAVAFAGSVEREVRRTITVDGQTAISIANTRGRTVVVGKPGGIVTIVANKWVRDKNEERAARILEAIKIEIEEDGDQIKVVATHPRHKQHGRKIWSFLRSGNQKARVDFTVEVPLDFNVRTSTTSGEVRISNLDGNARVIATSGDVALRELRGAVRVDLTSGRIEAIDISSDLTINATSGDADIERVSGNLIVNATSGDFRLMRVGGNATITLATGDVLLNGCLGNVELTTLSGDAELLEVGGNLVVTSASGDIDASIAPVGDKRFEVNTSSGDVDLFYFTPVSYGFLLDVLTSSGSITGNMDIKLEEITRRRLRGVVGSGKSRVLIETTSGDVSIYARNDGH